MAEEARLESVYTPKGYPGFESRSLRRKTGFKAFFLKDLKSLRRKTGFKAFFLKGLRRTQNHQFLKGLRRKGEGRFLVSQTHYYIIYSETDLS